MSLNIVLVEPEIPHNTGSIARSCALTKTSLHLIKPLGFSIDDKHLKRAGLDYWHLVDLNVYDNFQELLDKNPHGNFYFATTKTDRLYTEIQYEDNSFFVFGKETKGLPDEIIDKNRENLIKIPMISIGRSLNLANSANIIIFEALRQMNFSQILD